MDASASVDGDTDVTAAGAGVRTVVVTAREDVEIAAQVRAALR
jgi:acetate kinase